MLNQVADGVWVRQSAWVWSNAIAVRGEGGLILVDPGIDGSDLNQLADDLDRLGPPVVAGFSTHPHWDHLLWHPRFGDAPRYATPAGAHTANEARERAQTMAAESASGVPLELIGLVTPLPADGGPVPGTIVEHQAHAIGHAAVLLADRGVLLAGDMLSDVLIPLLDPRRPDQVGAYETALDRLGEAARHVDVVVPGHGAVAEGPEVAARLAADHAYIDALRRGEEPGGTTGDHRGADRLIVTAEHSVLGTRWIYDAVDDLVWVNELLRLVRTEGVSDAGSKRGVAPAQARGHRLTIRDVPEDPAIELKPCNRGRRTARRRGRDRRRPG